MCRFLITFLKFLPHFFRRKCRFLITFWEASLFFFRRKCRFLITFWDASLFFFVAFFEFLNRAFRVFSISFCNLILSVFGSFFPRLRESYTLALALVEHGSAEVAFSLVANDRVLPGICALSVACSVRMCIPLLYF